MNLQTKLVLHNIFANCVFSLHALRLNKADRVEVANLAKNVFDAWAQTEDDVQAPANPFVLTVQEQQELQKEYFVANRTSWVTTQPAPYSATYQTTCGHAQRKHHVASTKLGCCGMCGPAKVIGWTVVDVKDFDQT
jgi:hypothetical protein